MARWSLTISQKGLILVAVPLIFEVVFVGVMTKLHSEAEEELQRQAHSRAVIFHANDVMRKLLDAATAAGAYNLSHKSVYAEQFDRTMDTVDAEFNTLEDLVGDDPKQLKNIQEIRKSSADVVGLLIRLRNWHDDNPGFGMILGRTQQFGAVRVYVEKLTADLHKFTQEERQIDEASPAVQAQNRRKIVWTLMIGIALNILMALALAMFFTRGISNRLKVLADNTVRVSKRQSLNPKLEGNDEIAQLDTFFRKMIDHLAEADEMKKNIVAMVSHDLRTPLTSVQGTLSLLESGALGELPESARTSVHGADTNVARLIQLINDLLDVEKMDAGQLELSVGDVELNSVVTKSVEAVRQFAADRHIDIKSDPTDLVARADEERLVQVLVNLLSNAVKFSPEGSSVFITCRDHANEVELCVLDRGRGIPQEKVASIFEPYKQVDREDGAAGRGSGLGLAIVKMIVDQLGGSIDVESEPGVGSTFRVKLPKAESAICSSV